MRHAARARRAGAALLYAESGVAHVHDLAALGYLEPPAVIRAAGPSQGANCSPSGGSAAAKPQAWGPLPFSRGERHELQHAMLAANRDHAVGAALLDILRFPFLTHDPAHCRRVGDEI